MFEFQQCHDKCLSQHGHIKDKQLRLRTKTSRRKQISAQRAPRNQIVFYSRDTGTRYEKKEKAVSTCLGSYLVFFFFSPLLIYFHSAVESIVCRYHWKLKADVVHQLETITEGAAFLSNLSVVMQMKEAHTFLYPNL